MTLQTIREESYGKLTLRLLRTKDGYAGIVIGGKGGLPAKVSGGDPDEVWHRLEVEAGKAVRSYFGFDGAMNRFLGVFKDGFASPAFDARERGYKRAARDGLTEAVPLAAAASGSGFGEVVLSAFHATNLLSPFEFGPVGRALRGPHADDFVRAAARFALGAGEPALLDMERALRPNECAKWTVATYLPFLWRPAEHMFLKPEVTKDFAARVGHRFARDYEARLDMAVYASLLDLVACTREAIADLRPRDNIDVQSFIWVVSYYGEAERDAAT